MGGMLTHGDGTHSMGIIVLGRGAPSLRVQGVVKGNLER